MKLPVEMQFCFSVTVKFSSKAIDLLTYIVFIPKPVYTFYSFSVRNSYFSLYRIQLTSIKV